MFSGYNGGVFNATTGALESYSIAPFSCFSGATGLYTQANSLTAFSVSSGATLWTATPKKGDSYSSAPVIVNGYVYIGTAEGYIAEYSLATGKRVEHFCRSRDSGGGQRKLHITAVRLGCRRRLVNCACQQQSSGALA